MLFSAVKSWENKRSAGVLLTLAAPLTTPLLKGAGGMAVSQSTTPKICPICSAAFTRPANYSARQWDEHKTCSKPCGNELRRRTWVPVRIPLGDRFWAKVDKSDGSGPNSDCWQWTGACNNQGYGQIGLGSRKEKHALTHRVAWFLEFGVWPRLALHRCDNPKCVRVAHLFEGTQRDNVHDAIAKGRLWYQVKQ